MTATARPILARADLERFDPQAPRRRGRYRVCCPLCGAGKPVDAAHRSLTVNDADGLWYCHRCALGGQLREHWPERSSRSDQRQRVTAWAAWAFGKPASPPPPPNAGFADPHAAKTRTRTRDPRGVTVTRTSRTRTREATPRPDRVTETRSPRPRTRDDRVSVTATDARSSRPRTRDPRPDLEPDAALWAELLAVAHDLEPALPPGLYGALLGARCMGAHLEAGERTLRLTAPPDLAAEYAALRRDYLEPHAPMVRLLLEQARCSLADAEN